MSELCVIAFELHTLDSHEVALARPGCGLGGTALIEFTACRRKSNEGYLESGGEDLVQVLGAQLIENSPFNVHDTPVAYLQVLILNS